MARRPRLYDPPLFGADLEGRRDSLLNSTDDKLFGHIGHFVCWYGACEVYLEYMLMRLSQVAQPPLFRNLTLGMDARTKAMRVIEAVKLLELEIGPELTKRLDHFQKVHVKLRNSIVHTFPVVSDDNRQLELQSVDTLINAPGWPTAKPKPQKIVAIDLFERGLWLNAFALDLHEVALLLHSDPPTKTFELSQFRSSLPT